MKVCIYRSEKVYTLIYFSVVFVTLIFFLSPTVLFAAGFCWNKDASEILREPVIDVYAARTHFVDRQECVCNTGHRVRQATITQTLTSLDHCPHICPV